MLFLLRGVGKQKIIISNNEVLEKSFVTLKPNFKTFLISDDLTVLMYDFPFFISSIFVLSISKSPRAQKGWAGVIVN